jgi:polysaccharide export outer membrane protein
MINPLQTASKQRRWRAVMANTVMLAIMLMLSGCVSAKQQQLEQKMAASYSQRRMQSEEIETFNAKLLAGADLNSDPGDYLLGPGDLLQVTVFEAEELGTTVRVSSRGYITLPLLGQVAVEGLTAREAEVHIEARYNEKYIKGPHVSIFVEEHLSQRVTLIGQFKSPGTYDYPSKQRLLDVMALGGGLGDNAGRTAQIRRAGKAGHAEETLIVDLELLIQEGRSDLNIEINGGDVIFVPESGTFFITGAVRKPGAFPIKRQTILIEAISAAGGLAPYADADRIILVRHVGDGQREITELDLDLVDAQEQVIQDRDVIFARASAWGKLTHGFRINLGVPGAGVGYADPER